MVECFLAWICIERKELTSYWSESWHRHIPFSLNFLKCCKHSLSKRILYREYLDISIILEHNSKGTTLSTIKRWSLTFSYSIFKGDLISLCPSIFLKTWNQSIGWNFTTINMGNHASWTNSCQLSNTSRCYFLNNYWTILSLTRQKSLLLQKRNTWGQITLWMHTMNCFRENRNRLNTSHKYSSKDHKRNQKVHRNSSQNNNHLFPELSLLKTVLILTLYSLLSIISLQRYESPKWDPIECIFSPRLVFPKGTNFWRNPNSEFFYFYSRFFCCEEMPKFMQHYKQHKKQNSQYYSDHFQIKI